MTLFNASILGSTSATFTYRVQL